jgi:hypothetical protein
MAAQPSRPLGPRRTDLPASRSRRHQGRGSAGLPATETPLRGRRLWLDRLRSLAGRGPATAPIALPLCLAPRPESWPGSTWNNRLSRTGTPGRAGPSERRPRVHLSRGFPRWVPRTRRSVAGAHRCTGAVVPPATSGAALANGLSVEHCRARTDGVVTRRPLRPRRSWARP